jgi:hypothetical protein
MEKQITRKENWPVLLSEFISDSRDKKFKLGVNDCCFMPANCVKKLTGFDPAKEYRGKVKKIAEFEALLKEHGGVVGLYTHCLGFEPHTNKYLARRGDPVVLKLDQDDPYVGGIVDDSGRNVIAFSELKLIKLPVDLIAYVWEVG